MDEPDVHVVGEHLVGKSRRGGLSFYVTVVVIVAVIVTRIGVNHLPPLPHVVNDVIRKFSDRVLQHSKITGGAGPHNLVPYRIQPAVEHGVLPRPHDERMRVKYPFQQRRARPHEPDDEYRRARFRSQPLREEVWDEHRLDAGCAFSFGRGVEWRDRGHFVRVPLGQMPPRLCGVQGLGVVVREHGVVHPPHAVRVVLDAGGVVRQFKPVVRLPIPWQHRLQKSHQVIPSSLHGVLARGQNPRQSRHGVRKNPVLVRLQHPPVIPPGLHILPQNEQRLGAVRKRVQIPSIVRQAFLVRFHGPSEHVGHEVDLPPSAQRRAQ
mmetsp:Transcript_14545/g.35058  ORF Transcript_14545/g.35058 Transcript_14545/m.35058 type:complete len:321 (-) Transcript_14545:976-1938(-)